MKSLLFVIPPNMRVGDLPGWLRTTAKLRRFSGRDVHEMVRLFTMSAADLLDEWFDDPRVKGALATQAIVGGWCGPMTPGSAYVLMHHWIGEVDGHFGAWGWVKDGMGGVSAAMAASARAAGATIRTDVEVARIAIAVSGRAIGVELTDGSLIRADQVVSNVHPKTTYLDLVGADRLPTDVVHDVERTRTRSGSAKVHVALSSLPSFPSWDQEEIGASWADGGLTVDGVPGAGVRRREVRRALRHPYAEVMFPTAHQPEEIAPPGKHVMLGFTQYLPIATPNTAATRDAWAAAVLGAVGEYAPELAEAVEHVEVLTPKDLEDRFGLLGGNIAHGELAPDQLFSFRPIPFYGDYRTPVKGLYLCGAGTHPGGGVMGVPGRNAATVMLRDGRLGRATDRVRGLVARG